ncbi:Sec-independent protein translocase protein TatC [Phycisphaerae bacterium RAS1]|nr:Sec-independent protein translocase protein TatC [Phycisphaerae bacterium RAS1]
MTIGEHLDELRGCVVRSLLALVAAALLCIWPAKWLLAMIARPVILALGRHAQPTNFLAQNPAETLLIYVKVVLISGLILASPYILHQVWRFVGAGLYQHERRWVLKLLPPSAGLFLLGVAFMYLIVLPVSLNFLVGFSSWLPMPDATPTALERVLLGGPAGAATTQPASQPSLSAPVVDADPPHAPQGTVWFNSAQKRLKVRGVDQTYSLALQPDEHLPLVTTHFRIGEYLSFVLVLTVAFGLTFQTPLVVLFLARTGIVPVDVLRRSRRIVILAIVVIAGVLAPPDIASHLLLSVPMVALFEIGLLLAGRARPTGA